MITVEELLRPESRLREYTNSLPEMDPLTENDALQEAQLLDVRFDALRSTVGFLFELRGALQLRETNTGVLIARGVRRLSWDTEDRFWERTAWTVGGSIPSTVDGLFGLELGMWPAPGALLVLTAESAAFFAVDVPGLHRVPDYTDDNELTVRAQLASWHSECEPVSAVFLDPA